MNWGDYDVLGLAVAGMVSVSSNMFQETHLAVLASLLGVSMAYGIGVNE